MFWNNQQKMEKRNFLFKKQMLFILVDAKKCNAITLTPTQFPLNETKLYCEATTRNEKKNKRRM